MKLPGQDAVTNIKKLYRIFNQRQKKSFAWLIFWTFISSVSDLVGLSFIIPIVGLVLSDEFYNNLLSYFPFMSDISKNTLLFTSVAVFFCVIILKNVIGLLVNRMQVNFVKDLYLSSSTNVLNKIYKRNYLELSDEPSTRLANKLSFMQFGIANNTTLAVITVFNEVIIFSITSVVLLIWNWQLFLLMIAVIAPIMGIFYTRVKGQIKEAGIKKNNANAKIFAKTQEMVFGYADIKIAGHENYYKDDYKELVKIASAEQKKLNFINFLPTRILEVAVFLCIILILLYCVVILKDTASIITTISLFSIVAYRSIPSVNRLVVSMTQINAHEFILNDPDFIPEEITGNTEDTIALNFNNRILFDKVTYRYPKGDTDVLKDCSFEIKKGETIGIIGKSGSGKSTIINNLLGFLHPATGQILIDNTPLTKDNTNSWWKIVGYVRQDVFILNNTFLENIVMGEPHDKINHANLERAIKLASLETFVSELPDGLNTMLGERGNNLSGGQKQRIAIARAIYSGANVLVFDEATSSLDNQTEEEITNAIHALEHENLTIIIIAHRYTSLKYCDAIYRLENGSITGRINYESLAAEIAN